MEERHVAPDHPFYKGGFTEVGKCQDCGRVACRYEFHPVIPCRDCGALNTRREWFVAKWIETSRWWQCLRSGYWQRAADSKNPAEAGLL